MCLEWASLLTQKSGNELVWAAVGGTRQPARETQSAPEPATSSTLLGTAISPPDAAARWAPKCRHASMLAGDKQ